MEGLVIVYMDLNEIRKEIDVIDNELLNLFKQRMKLANEVAEYKKSNNLPVFQAAREDEIIKRIEQTAGNDLAQGAKVFFTNLMDISKCIQQKSLTEPNEMKIHPEIQEKIKAVCQGVEGANSEQAAKQLLNPDEISFVPAFEDVFKAVQNSEADYGIIPIENTTAGEVYQTYDLLSKYNLYIYKAIKIKINHVLAAADDIDIDCVTDVYSHEQALMQCSFLFEKHKNLRPVSCSNTAVAAKTVSEGNKNGNIAAICSPQCAEIYGLKTVSDNICNNTDNYTRFICVSKHLHTTKDADIISVSLSLPHTIGALYRLLTRFAVNGLNLVKIESKPVSGAHFDVIFYLDFIGSIKNTEVIKLLNVLENEMKCYKFLGNYHEQ